MYKEQLDSLYFKFYLAMMAFPVSFPYLIELLYTYGVVLMCHIVLENDEQLLKNYIQFDMTATFKVFVQ